MHALLKHCTVLIRTTVIAALPMGAMARETVLTPENGIAGTLDLPDDWFGCSRW
nr:hypothetical protein [Mesorhizobium loti]